MSKILVAIDGSDTSVRVVSYLATATSVFPATTSIDLIHVHLPIPSPRAVSWVGAEVVNKYYDDEAEIALTPARDVLRQHGRQFAVIKRVGDPGHEIAKAAKDGYVAIVMGTHGRTALLNLAMGSVATRVIAEATIPVMLIK
ncbi:MAG: universal stress protein [Gammaproteobacteria bacterium]|nr:universal stress protein [Gammaproteobacteria bacterium]